MPGVIASRWAMESVELQALPDALLNAELSDSAQRGVFCPDDVELPDGRLVELLEIQLDEGEAVLVFRTRRP